VQGGAREVRSVRRDHHAEDETCWLHGEGWCLSRREPANAGRSE
jgi:protein-L-isoaspartate(D-aspartate) O-methyltransferase